METKKNIIWLASYPKSGNTWFRSFITALLSEKEPDINKMETDGIFSDKIIFENVLDLSSDYLGFHQAEQYRRLVYAHLSNKAQKPLFIKIHDAFTFSAHDGLPIIPESPAKAAIYLIRNPLDVTLSLANHLGTSNEKTIEKFIINPAGGLLKRKKMPHSQFYQPLGTWNTHVESWLNNPTFPVHFMRYEDMKNKPFDTFKAALDAMDLIFTNQQIEKAIEETDFEKLKKKELAQGFNENQNLKSTFFNKGQTGRWKEELTYEQIEEIRNDNEPMMRYFGYWQ